MRVGGRLRRPVGMSYLRFRAVSSPSDFAAEPGQGHSVGVCLHPSRRGRRLHGRIRWHLTGAIRISRFTQAALACLKLLPPVTRHGGFGAYVVISPLLAALSRDMQLLLHDLAFFLRSET